jgi:malonate decarboxylase gamma subunit
MSDAMVFDRLFGVGQHQARIDGHFVSGPAQVAGRPVAVIGTWDAAAVDGALALAVARAILAVVAQDAASGAAPRPIVFIADTQGQEPSRHEELLGLNGCFAHVARCVDLARRRGHATLALIHGEAVSGGFLAFGMLADRICALPDAEVRVMDLRAMSRVTKIPLERLQALAEESPVFAPGASNYWRMGAVHELWPDDAQDWPARMTAVLAAAASNPTDQRADLGVERGGRTLAAPVAETVLDA